MDDATVERLAAAVLDQVEAKRSTWSRWNVVAATCRTMAAAGLQFATVDELLAARDRVGKAAMDRSVLLNPCPAPDSMAVTDLTTGRSIYEPPEIFTSPEVLAAEDALLHAADDASAPTGPGEPGQRGISAALPGGAERR